MKLKEIKPGTVIHCKTEREADDLFSVLKSMDITWNIGSPLRETHFSANNKGNRKGYYLNEHGRLECNDIDYYLEREMDITPFSSLIIEEKNYEDGLNEAWAAAKKIVLRKEHGGLPLEDLKKIFEREPEWEVEYSVFKNLTPQEAIAKLEAYEAEKRIKVGDVVEYFTTVSKPHVGIYLSETKNEHWVLSPHCEAPQSLEKKTGWQFRKTGKHIDISSILAEIRKE